MNVYVLSPTYEGDNPIEFQFNIARYGFEKNNIQYFTIRAFSYQTFMRLFNYNLRIVITKINLNSEDQKLYNMNIIYGKYADSQNQPQIEFSDIIPNNYQPPIGFPDYITNIFEIDNVSSCSEDYKINLICDTNLNMKESEINMTFIGKSGSIFSKCSMSPILNNKIVCQFNEDTVNLNSIVEYYLDIGKNELFFIFLKDNYTFPIECVVKPPIKAMIGLSVIYIIIIMMIILFILYFNRVEKGEEYDYENPQNSKGNNDLELNPIKLSK